MAVDTHNSTISTFQAEVDNLILDLYPRQGEWTEEEYLDLTDHTNHLIELTEGYVEVLPMPTDHQQSILLFLYGKVFGDLTLFDRIYRIYRIGKRHSYPVHLVNPVKL